MSSVCYVTAFLDLKREKWHTCSRSFEEYLMCFVRYIPFFYENQEDHMYVFMDKKYSSYIETLVKNVNISVIEIDDEWLNNNIPVWKLLPREKEIMESPDFIKLIEHRLDHPETYIPRYTMINHAKIDFVNYLTERNNFDYYTWVDFGYLLANNKRTPKRLLDPKKFVPNKVNFVQLNKIEEKDNDPIYTTTHAPERVMGGFFFGDKPSLKKYQEVYHKILYEFQYVLNIADDDQAVIIRSHFKYPDLVHLHNLGNWDSALTVFQRDKDIPTSSNPLVSVIIPSFERFELVQEAINSVLSQTYSNIEIIVVNDCSSDLRYEQLDQIYQNKPVKIIHLPENMRVKHKVSAAQGLTRNEGMYHARGKYIAFLDDDDTWINPKKLETQLKTMNEYKCKVCASNMFVSKGRGGNNITGTYFTQFSVGKKVGPNCFRLKKCDITNKNYINNSTCIVEKSLVCKVGEFLPIKYEDWNYWLRCLEYTDCIYIHVPLACYDQEPPAHYE